VLYFLAGAASMLIGLVLAIWLIGSIAVAICESADRTHG